MTVFSLHPATSAQRPPPAAGPHNRVSAARQGCRPAYAAAPLSGKQVRHADSGIPFHAARPPERRKITGDRYFLSVVSYLCGVEVRNGRRFFSSDQKGIRCESGTVPLLYVLLAARSGSPHSLPLAVRGREGAADGTSQKTCPTDGISCVPVE